MECLSLPLTIGRVYYFVSRNGREWLGMVGIGREWSRMVGNGRNELE